MNIKKSTITVVTAKVASSSSLCASLERLAAVDRLCLRWLRTRWPAARADIRLSSPASTVAHTSLKII